MMMQEIIAAVLRDGSWRGTLGRTQIAQLRLAGYTVRVLARVGDTFDVEVS